MSFSAPRNENAAPRRLGETLPISAPDYAGDALDRLNRVNFELTGIFSDAGYAPIEPAMLQPAELLFRLYGEEIWDRAFMFDDPEHGALCLRPDFTVPVARAHLAALAGGAAQAARYGYFGPVFRRPRFHGESPIQHLQAGVEIIGEDGSAERDAEVFDICRKALDWVGCRDYQVVTGDLGVAFAFLDAAPMPESWRRRLKRHFWRPERFAGLLRRFGGEEAAAAGAESRVAFLKAFGGLGAAEAASAVAEMVALSETPQIGVRSADEVAKRFLRIASDSRAHPLPRETVAALRAALTVSGPSPAALAELRAIAASAGLDLSAPLERLDRRLAALAAHGVDVDALAFDADFGRNLEYYDGFVFEMRRAAPDLGAGEDDAPYLKLGGGGRYDRLFTAMSGADPSIGGLGRIAETTGVGAALRPEALLHAIDLDAAAQTPTPTAGADA